MSPSQYRAALARLGYSQEGVADLLGIGKRTSQGYALGESPIPLSVEVLLKLMLTGKIKPADVEAAHGR
jgi:transcriptional regulator with XRE-family HTH domain